ncbi:hypothetical protein OXIME_001077 [Oxyplasma meridianum]|uniref:Uncharacterized protein n=1 Tax=Oxyplasma meridianum TaxID=3073602 RepID=A0AAX4NI81_9ARCH
MEPFYFRSYYHCVKGVAHDRKELESELKRLKDLDPGCVQYHLEQKHISNWLRSIGEVDIAHRLESAVTVDQALDILSKRKSASGSRKPVEGEKTLTDKPRSTSRSTTRKTSK